MLISAQQNKEEMLISTVSFTAVVCLLFLWDRREPILELSLHLLFVSSFGQELQDNETVSLGPSIALFITGAQRYNVEDLF
jgi:hypothetical protein